MTDLPFIDEHAVDVEADPGAVWDALVGSFGTTSGSGFFALYAKAIGVEPGQSEGDLGAVGSTRVGFRVSESDPPERLVLTGSHHFSNYALTWKVTPLSAGRSRLAAITNAEFPGIHGRAYKAVVIDSGIHGQVTRRMLSAVARQAQK